jgi:hypothetical protein
LAEYSEVFQILGIIGRIFDNRVFNIFAHE